MVTITLDADTAQKLRDALSDAPKPFVAEVYSATGNDEVRRSVAACVAKGMAEVRRPVPSLQPVEWRVYPDSENLLHTIDKYGPQRMAETDAGRYLVQRGTLIRNGEYYERAPTISAPDRASSQL